MFYAISAHYWLTTLPFEELLITSLDMCGLNVMHFIWLQLFNLLVQEVLVNHSTDVKEGVSHSKERIRAEIEKKKRKKEKRIKINK